MEASQSQAQAPTPHLAMVPTPGLGHLIPLVEFAKRLADLHHFTITIVIPTGGPPSKAQLSVLNSLPSTVEYVFLPPVSFDDIPAGSKIETIITLAVPRSLPWLRDALKSMVARTNLVGLVVDVFGTDAFEVAKEFNLPHYIFFPSSAMALSLVFYLPKLHAAVAEEYGELSEPIKIPGCITVHGKDLPDAFQHRKNVAYNEMLRMENKYALAEGIILNSFLELEPGAIKALREELRTPPIYPVGPLVNMDSSGREDAGGAECLKWLDEQPHGSVLFVSFGSGGTLSSDQINELSLGLEMSEQRFLWVVKSPSDKAANATYFSVHSQKDTLDFLPEGFLQRTKGRGLVVPSWVPQAQILSHPSTGGFLTHCGWNSILESVVNGVPLIAWPLYAEQRMNAAMLTDDIEVALRAKMEENGVVEREEIARMVKSLLVDDDGRKVRTRMKNLKNAAERVVGEDGSSTKTLSALVLKWNGRISS